MPDAVAFGVDVGAALGLLDDVGDEVGFADAVAGGVTVGVVPGVGDAGAEFGIYTSTPFILFFAVNPSL